MADSPNPIGRPSVYSDETASIILDRLANGESLKRICQDENMPARSTIYLWLTVNKLFSDNYARARQDQADSLADDILAIADDEGIPSDSRRIRVDARKWIASKLKPGRYADRVDTTLTGANGGPLQFQEVVRRTVDPNGNP